MTKIEKIVRCLLLLGFFMVLMGLIAYSLGL